MSEQNNVIQFYAEYNNDDKNLFNRELISVQAVFETDKGLRVSCTPELLDNLDTRFALIEDNIVYFCEHMFKVIDRDDYYYNLEYVGEMSPDDE